MQSQYITAIIVTLFAITQAEKYLREKPPQLTPCKTNGSNLSKCLSKNFQTLFVEFKDGVPGLSNVGKLEPLLVKRIKISQDDNKAISLNMDLKNVQVFGASKAIVQETRLDTKNFRTISSKIFVPRLDFESDYKVKGRVLSLPLNGNGKSTFAAENVVLICQLTIKLRNDGDLTFMEIETLEGSISQIGNFNIKVDNLFNGKADLEESANALFNENWREIYETLRPAIEQTVSKVLEDRLKKVFHYVPFDYFVEDLPK